VCGCFVADDATTCVSEVTTGIKCWPSPTCSHISSQHMIWCFRCPPAPENFDFLSYLSAKPCRPDGQDRPGPDTGEAYPCHGGPCAYLRLEKRDERWQRALLSSCTPSFRSHYVLPCAAGCGIGWSTAATIRRPRPMRRFRVQSVFEPLCHERPVSLHDPAHGVVAAERRLVPSAKRPCCRAARKRWRIRSWGKHVRHSGRHISLALMSCACVRFSRAHAQ